MDGYTQESLWLNGKTIALSDILSTTVKTTTEFERDTIDFIKAWLSGQQTFTVHTSGSTGTPKPIIITREQMIGSARRTLQALNIKASQTALICLPTRYIAGKMMLVRALIGDLKMIIVEPASNPLSTLITTIDFAAFVPLQLQEIVESEKSLKKLNDCQCALIGGAKISPIILNQLESVKCSLILTYGMTETVSHVALHHLNQHDITMNFQALPGVTFTIDDRDCLIINDSNLPEPVITNDIVKLFSDSEFQLLGRHDYVINSGGIKHSPEQIETLLFNCLPDELKSIPFFIGPYADQRLGHVLAIYLEERVFATIEVETLKLAVKKMRKLERPRKLILIPMFSYTGNTKVERKKTIHGSLNSANVIDLA